MTSNQTGPDDPGQGSSPTGPSYPPSSEYGDRPTTPAQPDGPATRPQHGERPAEPTGPATSPQYGDRSPTPSQPTGPATPPQYGQRPGTAPIYGQRPYGGAPSGSTPYSGAPSGSTPYGGTPYTSSPYTGAPYAPRPYASQSYGPPPVQPVAPAPVAKTRQRRGSTGLIAAVAATALLAGGGGAVIGSQLATGPTGASATSTTTSTVLSPANASTVSSVARDALPSVVTIDVRGATQAGTGSGVILSQDGLIITNNHVVAAASGGTIKVEFADGTTAAASVVGADPTSDIAVIRAKGVSNLKPATFADSKKVAVGELVVAIGSPLGLNETVTSGVVSAVDRPVRTGDSSSQAVIDAIQTDAAINPGNSGGALLNGDGQVIGINSAIATLGSSSPNSTQSGNIGVGFAIPSDTARGVADQLIKNGVAVHAQLGVEASSFSNATTSGAQVQTVVPNGPAAKAGLQPGDVITNLDGRTIEDVDTLVVAVRSHSPGDSVTVQFLHKGKQQTATATLTKAPTQ